jgi:PAS domain S-box-containing protein
LADALRSSQGVEAQSGGATPWGAASLGDVVRDDTDRAARHYAAIVESSDDAILSKSIDGVILSWNAGAQRLFGFSAEEAVGKPATIIIPTEREDEELAMLYAIRNGEAVRQLQTERLRKDGTLVDVSLTASPIRDENGRIIGASTIAHDIGELKRARERQRLLLREMSHRVKNLFALAGSVVTLSGRSATTPQEVVSSVRERLAALARAQALTFSDGETSPQPTSLHALIHAIVAPFDDPGAPRIAITGIDAPVSGGAVTALALLVHEFATNAAKYGPLSADEGTIAIECAEVGDNIAVTWTERGGPPVVEPGQGEGFGSVLSRMAVERQLGGKIARDWGPDGLTIHLSAPKARFAA